MNTEDNNPTPNNIPNTKPEKITDRPIVIFLSTVVAAFVAGITTWIFLTNQIDARTRAAIFEMKNRGELPPGPPGPPGPVAKLAVIARGGGPQSEIIYGDTVVAPQPGILFVTARTAGAHRGATVNAGLRIETRLDGKLIAANEEFEGSSASITFQATATSATYIAASPHRLEVKIVPQALTEKPEFVVDWFVIGTDAEVTP
jgi:hypothetical protein